MQSFSAIVKRGGSVVEWLRIFLDGPPSPPPWTADLRQGCTVYTGSFVIYRPGGRVLRMVSGRIVEREDFPTEVYVYDPPIELRHHPTKGPCLQLLHPGQAWFRLNWTRPARDFETARVYVEGLLDEALRR